MNRDLTQGLGAEAAHGNEVLGGEVVEIRHTVSIYPE